MTASIVYCVDSSALIDLRMLYRRSTFPGVWQDLSELVSKGRLIAPAQVWAEIRNDDVLPAWVREGSNRRMFVRLKVQGLQMAKEIIEKFPRLVDPDKETPDADPFVIALAIVRNREPKDLFAPSTHIVVTSERRHPQGELKIPHVCRDLGIKCMFGQTALADLFETESWHYK